MSLSRKMYLTALVIWRSLVPQRHAPEVVAAAPATVFGVEAVPARGDVPVHLLATSTEISWFLTDPGRGLRKNGEFACLFTGCLAPAAPFVLFRLKRKGFSNCRVTAGGEGLLVEGKR